MRNPNISKKIFSVTKTPLLIVILVTILLLLNVVGGVGSSLSSFTVGSAAAEESKTTTTTTTTTQQYPSFSNTINSIASYNTISLVNSTMQGGGQQEAYHSIKGSRVYHNTTIKSGNRISMDSHI